MLRAFLRQLQRLGPAGGLRRRLAMHREVFAHLATFLPQQQRNERLRSESPSEQGEDARACGGAKGTRWTTVLLQQASPNQRVLSLDIAQPAEH
jgi:hypothetical protein